LETDILELVEKSPKVFEILPTERLRELLKIYDKKIEENERKIEYLRTKLKSYKG